MDVEEREEMKMKMGEAATRGQSLWNLDDDGKE